MKQINKKKRDMKNVKTTIALLLSFSFLSNHCSAKKSSSILQVAEKDYAHAIRNIVGTGTPQESQGLVWLAHVFNKRVDPNRYVMDEDNSELYCWLQIHCANLSQNLSPLSDPHYLATFVHHLQRASERSIKSNEIIKVECSRTNIRLVSKLCGLHYPALTPVTRGLVQSLPQQQSQVQLMQQLASSSSSPVQQIQRSISSIMVPQSPVSSAHNPRSSSVILHKNKEKDDDSGDDQQVDDDEDNDDA